MCLLNDTGGNEISAKASVETYGYRINPKVPVFPFGAMFLLVRWPHQGGSIGSVI